MLSVVALWIARLMDDAHWRTAAERTFFTVMLIVACGTLRTILANDGCWLLHTGSLCVMVLGAIFPQLNIEGDTYVSE